MSPTSPAPTAAAFLQGLADAVAVMGIVNVTPDSFSGDGVLATAADPVAQARRMQQEGCRILDIGGESTRPGSRPVDPDEEQRRVLPVIAAVRDAVSLPISVDTFKAEVARKAVEAGACIVNDVWGLQRDPAMAETVARSQAGLIVMHNRDRADPAIDIMADIAGFFRRSLALAADAGIPPEMIALDPGIGFGKTIRQNFIILNRLDRLRDFGMPLLIGLSRKRFIGDALDRPVDQRLIGTVAANLFAVRRGAAIIRVHDVREHVEALAMTAAIESEYHD